MMKSNCILILNLFVFVIGERAKRARHSHVCSIENRGYIYIIGERAKRARHSQVCSIENRGYILLYTRKWFPFVRERAHS